MSHLLYLRSILRAVIDLIITSVMSLSWSNACIGPSGPVKLAKKGDKPAAPKTAAKKTAAKVRCHYRVNVAFQTNVVVKGED